MSRSEDFSEAELGESIGQLRDASDWKQYAVLVLAIVVGVAAGILLKDFGKIAAPLVVLCVGAIGCRGILFLNTDAFCTQRLQLYEFGFIVHAKDRSCHTLRFRDLETFAFQERSQYFDGSYTGSVAKFAFKSGNANQEVVCDFEYHPTAPTGKVVAEIKRRCMLSICEKLSVELERNGQIPWTRNTFLTLDAIRIVDESGADRLVPLMDIKVCQPSIADVKFFREADTVPVLTLQTNGENFLPVLHLFSTLYNCYEKQDEQTSTVSVMA